MLHEDSYEERRAQRLSDGITPGTVDPERIAVLVNSRPVLPDPALFGISTEAPAVIMVEDKPDSVQDIVRELYAEAK